MNVDKIFNEFEKHIEHTSIATLRVKVKDYVEREIAQFSGIINRQDILLIEKDGEIRKLKCMAVGVKHAKSKY